MKIWFQWSLFACLLSLTAAARAAIPVEHWTQDSGAEIYFVESPAIPMLDVQIDFDAGSRRDPAQKAGLASAAALISGKGLAAREGRPALDENQLGEAWADLGSGFSASAGSDRMSFSLRTLTEPDLLEQSVQLAARQLGEPSWPQEVWERDRQRLSASIQEALTRPGTISQRAFEQAVFGAHPYGQQTTPETLARITADDLKDFHDRHVLACQAKVTLVGAVSRAQADDIAAKLLSYLPASAAGACPQQPAVPPVAPLAQMHEQDISHDSAQAHVLLGQPGVARTDPDYFALRVGNHILGGGGFSSRLMAEVREKRGLTYGVYSGFWMGASGGNFILGLQTRPDQAEQALEIAREVLQEFVAEGPTEAELQDAKDNMIGSFPLLLDSNRKLLGNVANMAWYDLPLDYLDDWTSQVEAVTAQDIQRAFQRVLQPERMVTVVLRPEKD